MTAIPDNKAPYAGVICHGHDIPEAGPCGRVDMTEAEYVRQLDFPNRGWSCPLCGASADFDDERFEELAGLTEPLDPQP